MKIYHSFLVRLWLIRESAGKDHDVYEIENIQTGEQARMHTLIEAQDWMTTTCQNEMHAARSPTDRGE
jgi:hypothetical protein